MKKFDASLEWFLERVNLPDEEINTIKGNRELEESEKTQVLRAQRMKSINDVVEEVGVLIDTHFFNEFSETKSSLFLRKVISCQSTLDVRLLKKTGRT